KPVGNLSRYLKQISVIRASLNSLKKLPRKPCDEMIRSRASRQLQADVRTRGVTCRCCCLPCARALGLLRLLSWLPSGQIKLSPARNAVLKQDSLSLLQAISRANPSVS